MTGVASKGALSKVDSRRVPFEKRYELDTLLDCYHMFADSRVLHRESLNDVPGAMVESDTCMLEDRWCAQWNCLDLFGTMPCRIFCCEGGSATLMIGDGDSAVENGCLSLYF